MIVPSRQVWVRLTVRHRFTLPAAVSQRRRGRARCHILTFLLSIRGRVCCPIGRPSTTKEGYWPMVTRQLGIFALAASLAISVSGVAHSKSLRQAGAHSSSGLASYYGTKRDGYAGKRTASGERVSSGALTAAHKSLPFGTHVRVTNQRNGKSVVVRINDRGPFVRGRVIDLTPAGATAIGMSGLAPVSLAVVGRNS